MVSVDRWSLYRGALVRLKGTMSQATVVSIDRWSLYVTDLFTVCTYVRIACVYHVWDIDWYMWLPCTYMCIVVRTNSGQSDS